VALFRHAPFPDELHEVAPDDWAIPPLRHIGGDEAKAEAASPREIKQSMPAEAEGYSLNEIDAELRKAARGAGLSWGIAEDVGRMGRCLARFVPQHLDRLADALEDLQSGRHAARVISDPSGIRSPDDRPLSPLVLGPAIADRLKDIAAGTLAITSPAAQPDLLVPILASLAERLQRPLRLRMKDFEITIDRDKAPALAALTSRTGAEEMLISAPPQSRKLDPAPAARSGGIAIADKVWRRFNALAALTYVPASEHSRLAGAGAGLSDND
jgi:hypothetical protein